mgnify:CR=1 FL=1|jgi:hypothetical protein
MLILVASRRRLHLSHHSRSGRHRLQRRARGQRGEHQQLLLHVPLTYRYHFRSPASKVAASSSPANVDSLTMGRRAILNPINDTPSNRFSLYFFPFSNFDHVLARHFRRRVECRWDPVEVDLEKGMIDGGFLADDPVWPIGHSLDTLHLLQLLRGHHIRSSGMDIIVARASQGIAKDLLRYSAEPISIGTRCCQDAAMEIRDAVYILQAAIQRSAKIQLSIITQSQNYVMLLVVYGSYRGRYLDAPIAVEELATPLVEAAESSV